MRKEDKKMGLAISQLTSQNLMNVQSDCEYQLTLIMNTLQRLANEQAAITTEQMTASQTYLAQFDKDSEEYDVAIEWVNSEAFNARFNAKLAEIQAKEQQLDIQKQQVETRQKMASNQRDGWEKNTTSCIEKMFKYGN